MLTLVVAPTPVPFVLGRQVNTWRDEFGRVCGTGYSEAGQHYLAWPGAGLFAFADRSTDVRVWPDPGVSHSSVQLAWERMLQPIALQALGHQALHGSAFEAASGAVALIGSSHSGKSTHAFAMTTIGCRQLADDGVVVTRSNHQIWKVRPLTFVRRLRPASLTYFSGATPPEERLLPEREAPVPLAAVVILAQDRELASPIQVGKVAPAEAFATTLAHAHCFDPDRDTARMAIDYLDLVAQVPVYALTYRPDFDDLSHVLKALLDLAGGPLVAAESHVGDSRS